MYIHLLYRMNLNIAASLIRSIIIIIISKEAGWSINYQSDISQNIRYYSGILVKKIFIDIIFK